MAAINTFTLEGEWEDIQKQAKALAHRRVQVTVLPQGKRKSLHPPRSKPRNAATEQFLRDFFGKWAGDDFEECLASVYASRSKAKF